VARAAWGDVVHGQPHGEDWLKVGEYFLPMQIKGTPVLRLQVALYLVDNAGLRSTTAGLRFRNSPVLQDKTEDETERVSWGSFVQGKPIGERWLKVRKRYLPMFLRGNPVLKLQAGLLQFVKEENVTRCPSCKQGIQKNGGCDHVKCRCGSEFCFACGADYHGKQGIFVVGNHAHGEGCIWYRPPPSRQAIM